MTIDSKYPFRQPYRIWFDTFGGMAVSALLICIISGIILAVPFDVGRPYLSISRLMISDPGAVLARNMHYWSAQLFLLLSILHIWDQLLTGSHVFVRRAVWFRLTLSIFAILFAMLSGFLLKADADSHQAMLIFRSLFDEIPLAGGYISSILLGRGDSFVLLYINHAALATIFILLILFEHARVIWGNGITFIIFALVLIILAMLFRAPLQAEYPKVIKGPWYFLGMQELLHWMRRPGLIWLIALLFFTPLFLYPYLTGRLMKAARYFLLIFLAFYIILTITAYFFRGEDWKLSLTGKHLQSSFALFPLGAGSFADELPAEIPAFGRAEGCMLCHHGMEGFSSSHDPEVIGCAACHLGDPFSPEKNQAHKGMLAVPGNLGNAGLTCGSVQCHPGIVPRVKNNIMNTLSGLISVNRFVFNEIPAPDGHYSIEDIGHGPADQHLRNMCVRCHIGNYKADPGPVTEESRGGGCNACHLNYTQDAIDDLRAYYGAVMPDSSLWKHHPSLDLNIGNEHCFGCHSRSGRISASYEGWHETLLTRAEAEGRDTLRVLDDGRVFRFISDDVHHRAGLLCIDCHDSYELMGDGKVYMHKEDQVMIACEDCHFSRESGPWPAASVDAETMKILGLKALADSSIHFLSQAKTGRALWNTGFDAEGNPVLSGKVSKRQHPLAAPGDNCSRGNAHERLSCQACHSSWVPQCVGCHNEYDPQAPGYDMIARKEETGSWVEYVGLYLAGLPALGVIEGDRQKVHTFSPGMILTIDKTAYDADAADPFIFHRLYAPMSAHTTDTAGRSCRSCHNDPFALGYGHGVLEYEVSARRGSWKFTPRFAASRHDGLPEDAWIPFLAEPDGRHSTRSNTRPFTLQEQERILRVGACLECHDESSEIMLLSVDDFKSVMELRSPKCILPFTAQ